MMLNLSYQMEKMTNAVSMMATNQGGIKNRLCQAYGEFHMGREEVNRPPAKPSATSSPSVLD